MGLRTTPMATLFKPAPRNPEVHEIRTISQP
jgi:hypothetical protein